MKTYTTRNDAIQREIIDVLEAWGEPVEAYNLDRAADVLITTDENGKYTLNVDDEDTFTRILMLYHVG